jgi:rhamnulokinase
VSGGYAAFDAAEARFLAPASMEAEVRAAAGIAADAPRSVVVRAAVAAMAVTAARVIDRLDGVREVVLFGGGAGVDLLRSDLSVAAGLPVRVGPTEAAALGNALVQGVAVGAFPDLASARRRLHP